MKAPTAFEKLVIRLLVLMASKWFNVEKHEDLAEAIRAANDFIYSEGDPEFPAVDTSKMFPPTTPIAERPTGT